MMREEYGRVLPGGQGQDEERPFQRSGLGYFGSIRLMPLVLPLALVFGCSRAEEPVPNLPDAVSELLSPTETEVASYGPGLTYYGLRSSEEPRIVHLLRVELGRCDLGLQVLEAPILEDDGAPGRSPVSTLLAQDEERIIAGINGDFFSREGFPLGTEVVGGSTRQARSRPALAWRPGREPWIGVPGLEGDSVLLLGWRLSRTEGDGESEVVSGYPLLLQSGSQVGDLGVADRPSFSAERHPRTAVGFDWDANLLWFVVVDGRQPGYSVGMTLPELAGLLRALGIEDGLNLDGGGSSVMVLDGEVRSSPSDPEGERPVVNALSVRRDSTYCRRRQ